MRYTCIPNIPQDVPSMVQSAVSFIDGTVNGGTSQLSIRLGYGADRTIAHAYIEEFEIREPAQHTVDLAQREWLRMVVDKDGSYLFIDGFRHLSTRGKSS